MSTLSPLGFGLLNRSIMMSRIDCQIFYFFLDQRTSAGRRCSRISKAGSPGGISQYGSSGRGISAAARQFSPGSAIPFSAGAAGLLPKLRRQSGGGDMEEKGIVIWGSSAAYPCFWVLPTASVRQLRSAADSSPSAAAPAVGARRQSSSSAPGAQSLSHPCRGSI